jgi:anti-sigma factor RsiW
VTAEPPPDPDERTEPSDIDEAIAGKVSEYLDGALGGAERAEVERKIEHDATWKRAHAELTETRNYLSGLRKAHAPSSFTEGVEETIHKRSAGRFFGPRTFGDRVPFSVLLVVALAGLLAIGYVLRSSSTGSLKVDHGREHAAPQGSAVVVPP